MFFLPPHCFYLLVEEPFDETVLLATITEALEILSSSVGTDQKNRALDAIAGLKWESCLASPTNKTSPYPQCEKAFQRTIAELLRIAQQDGKDTLYIRGRCTEVIGDLIPLDHAMDENTKNEVVQALNEVEIYIFSILYPLSIYLFHKISDPSFHSYCIYLVIGKY